MDLKSAKLIILDGPQVGKIFPLENLPLTIGRTDASKIVIPDGSISRKHAEVDIVGSGLHVKDLGSKNGIEVNGRKTRTSVEIFDGDKITIGKIKLKCVMPYHLRPVPVKESKPIPVKKEEVAVKPKSNVDHSNTILATVLGLGIILAVLAMVLVYDDSADPPQIYTLSVGEEILVNTDRNVKNMKIEIENQRVVRVRPDKAISTVVWLKGSGMGNSLVRFLDAQGKQILSCKAIVRGQYHDIAADLGIMDLDNDDRLRLARNFEKEAISLKRDSLLESLYTYDKALVAIKDMGEEEYYLELQNNRELVLKEFKATFKALGQEFSMARSNKDPKGMINALKKIKILVPESTHPYYQKAKYYRAWVKKRYGI